MTESEFEELKEVLLEQFELDNVDEVFENSEKPIRKLSGDELLALQEYSKKDDNVALFLLGMEYVSGISVPQDDKIAHRCFMKAAKLGNGMACCELAWDYQEGRGTRKNSRLSIHWNIEGTERNVPACLINMGNLADKYGYYAKTVEMYTRAAELGIVNAEYLLGESYCHGFGPNRNHINFKKAFYWLNRAAEHGHAFSMNDLANLYEYGKGTDRNIEQAVYWYCKAAESGDREGYYNQARIYYDGIGTEVDFSKAFALYKKAAEMGEPESQRKVGFMLLDGEGTNVDEEEGLRWLSAASDQEDAQAMTFMALRYQAGNGVEQNDAKAFDLLKRSVEKEFPLAIYNLGCWYLYGTIVEESEKKGFLLIKQSVEMGCKEAEAELGWCYECGIGTRKSYRKAFFWFECSARHEQVRGMYL